ncbi:protein ced-11-like protein [Leptotrombidium deliense]|uniref:Protein ced-11-like protein n=1 Tax=Leptotrombidium deliense TaxID=299467 RepID=A0A443SHC6_9ACAR|nr:protein ced-11-like protein [Leptotrombidium deliense]
MAKGAKNPPVVVTRNPMDSFSAGSTADDSGTISDAGRLSNASNDDMVQVRSRRGRSFFRSIAHRLHVAGHISRAKRADNVTGFDSEPVIDSNIPLSDVRRAIRQESRLSAQGNRQSYNEGDVPAVQRQFSSQSRASRKGVTQNMLAEQQNATRNYYLGRGTIQFWKNFAFEQEGHPFLKVNHDVHVEDVASAMYHYWGMPPPRIVSLIISNVDSLREWTSVRQRISFQKGLMKAANTTNMWIFTNGANIGASKIIGDAVEQEVKQKQSLFSSSSTSSTLGASVAPQLNIVGVIREDMLKYADALTMDSKVTIENLGNSPEEGKYELNANHTHFLVVKDNSINKTGINMFILRIMQFLSMIGGIEFGKEALENEKLAKIRDVPDICSLNNMEIPVVCIVIQGGYDCARLVLDCLKRQFPVVVLRGSGGLADLLAYAYMEIKQRSRDAGPWGNWDPEYIESYLKPEISGKIVHYFPKFRDNALARNIFRDRILDCIRLAKQGTLSFLTVLNMHNHSECQLENLSVYLLRALFKSKPMSDIRGGGDLSDDKILKELYLTLDWNCADVAKSEVLIKDPGYVVRLQKDLFLAALLRPDREEFVDLFLTHGFRVHKFITPTRLRKLFKFIYNEEFFRTVCWEGVLGHSLLSKPSRYFIDTDLNWLIETCTGLEHFVNSDHLYYNVLSMYVRNASSAERKALTMLTMWAVFGNKQKLVKTLWKHSDQPVHLALVVSMMYERLSWYVSETNVKNELKDQSKKFADLAIGVLDDCFEQQVTRAFDVLSEESPDWNHKTAVDIAANARTRSFLAHPCCQKWITNTFLGDIRIRELSWGFLTIPASVKILFCAILILPMYVWVRFKPKVSAKTNVTQDQEVEEDERDGDQMMPTDDTNLLSQQQKTGGSVKLEPSNSVRRPSQPPKPPYNNKANEYYTTLLRDRELFIRSQPPLWKMVVLMWCAPITKFYTFQFFYLLFLALFSIATLYPSYPDCGSAYLDIAVCLWTALVVIEYIRRTYLLYRKYTSVPLVYKCAEITVIVGFVIVFSLSNIFQYHLYTPYTRKIILSIGLLYFYYRFIAIYLPISPTLGPLLYRLQLMIMVDFVNFMRMALIIIFSSGIVLQAILYPDLPISMEVFRQAFHRAWFALFITPIGELEFKPNCTVYEDTGTETCAADTDCPNRGVWPYVFSIQYFVLLKLILMTLLYALFASTASKLSAETDAIWKYQRYILVADFSSRLPLPAPLSIFCYIYYILKYTFRTLSCYYCIRWCKKHKKKLLKKDTTDGPNFDDSAEKKYNLRLSEEDYNFWRHLAREHCKKIDKKAEEADIAKKQWESIQSISEEIEYEKKLLRQLKGKTYELERMMTVSHVFLENIKHLASSKFGLMDPDYTQAMKSHHVLSRQSPYPGTRVNRIPVPDKFVPWEVMWIDYDPVAYTKQKIDFANKLEQYVDEDILLLQELNMEEVTSKLPVYQWNCSSTNAAGITIDRRSWCVNEDGVNILYKLDNAIPRNPFGRTGLRGRGALPRWGPNHYVTLIITRWQNSKVPIGGGKVLELVVEKNPPRWDQLSLPSRFIPGDNLYTELQTLFKTSSDNAMPWNSSEAMINAFKSCCSTPVIDLTGADTSPPDPGLKYEMVHRGYMDDPFNTDHSWKEVELWHFHFTTPDTLHERMHSTNVSWRIITEDAFIKLPAGHAALLQDITNKLQPAIL